MATIGKILGYKHESAKKSLNDLSSNVKNWIKNNYPEQYKKIKNSGVTNWFSKYDYAPTRENAQVRHEVQKNKEPKITPKKSEKKVHRNRSKIPDNKKVDKTYKGDTSTNNKAYKKNVSSTAQTKIKNKLKAGRRGANTLSNIFKSKAGRVSMYALGGMVLWNAVSSRLLPHSKESVIPKHYERSYDYIKERTDFGSPIKLHKTAQKVNVPYVSSTRRANVTTVNSVIDKNFSLFSSRNAIRHTEY